MPLTLVQHEEPVPLQAFAAASGTRDPATITAYREEDREERMRMDIVGDCHGEEERALGWYNYLADTLAFPFIAHCRVKRAISPLHIGDEVDVIGMAPEEECHHEIFVLMRWERDGLAVPLSQLTIAYADDETRQAVGDWLYWVDRGYRF